MSRKKLILKPKKEREAYDEKYFPDEPFPELCVMSAEEAWSELLAMSNDYEDGALALALEAGRALETELAGLEKNPGLGDGNRAAVLKAKTVFWKYVFEFGRRRLWDDDAMYDVEETYGGEDDDGLVYTADGTILLFCDDHGMVSCRLRPGTKAVADWAFAGIETLESVTMPRGVEFIGENAFRGCTGLRRAVLPEGGTLYIDAGAFSGCTSMREITVPEGTAFLRDWTFEGCSSLRKVGLPESLAEIGAGVFFETALEKVTLPRNLSEVSRSSFEGCEDLEITNASRFFTEENSLLLRGDTLVMTLDQEAVSAVVPEHVKEIGPYAFLDADVESVSLPRGLVSVGAHAFEGCCMLEGITLPEGITSIGNSAFAGCYSLRRIDIPEGVRIIGMTAFESCDGLESVGIPSSAAVIGPGAFDSCGSLSAVDVPDGVKVLGHSAFLRCAGLESARLPDSLRVLPPRAFLGCSALETLVLGRDTVEIGESALEDCGSLGSLTCLAPRPPECGKHAFKGTDKLSCVVSVPAQAMPFYLSEGGWKDFRNIMGIPEAGPAGMWRVWEGGKPGGDLEN